MRSAAFINLREVSLRITYARCVLRRTRFRVTIFVCLFIYYWLQLNSTILVIEIQHYIANRDTAMKKHNMVYEEI